MKKIKLTILILLSVCTLSVGAQDKKAKKVLKPDGPYITYNDDLSMRYVEVKPNGRLLDTIYQSIPKDFTFKVTSDNKKYSFDVTIAPIKKQLTELNTKGKVLALSDPHGDFESFQSVLLANNVIDDKFNWDFGKNTLVLVGDVFDRGNDATTILWLLYKLENQAKKVGGNVLYMIGNHEDLVLKGDDRYLKKKYVVLADTLKMAHKNLYAKNTELGRWIRSKNLVQIINKNLFVHAGLGKGVLEHDIDFDFANNTVEEYLGRSKKDLQANASEQVAFIYGTYGLIWYRGMSYDDEKYQPLSKEDLSLIMKKYGAKKIIIGHTIFEDVAPRYDGNIIPINVDNDDNREDGKGRGILIDSNKYYVIYDSGKLVRMFK